MKKLILLICGLFLLNSCTTSSSVISTPTPASSPSSVSSITPSVTSITEPSIVLPIAEYAKRRTVKYYGKYVQDRFTGYHVGDDIEYTDIDGPVAVHAITDGTIEMVSFVSGYGGFIRIKHTINNQTIHSIYGHIALNSAQVKIGDKVKANQFLANLGKGNSSETDGERSIYILLFIVVMTIA